MNDEKPSTEAEQTKLGDLTASIERMIADLGTIESIIRTTRLLAEGMENGGLKWATLCKALGEIRHILGPCAIMPDACFPPLGEVKDAPTPLDPSVQTGGGATGTRGDSYMSKPEAAYILCRMATSRKVDVSGVTALQMGVRSLMKRHFDRQRNWARRRARAAGEAEEKQP